MEVYEGYSQSFNEFKGKGDYLDNKFLMATPYPVTLILGIYLWFVLRMGPELMNYRKPYVLKNTILVYNILQVLISCYIVNLGLQLISRFGLWSYKCNTKNPAVEHQVLDGNYIYFLAKLVELLDTVFFVLRKKGRQITFLHIYHHTIMVICTWSIAKYITNDSVVFFATINSLVHVFMYGYYALSVFPSLTKYLWWKKYITVMQLIQFVMMFIHMMVSHSISECKPTYYLLSMVCFNTVLFLFLFGDFYIKSYTKTSNKSVEIAPTVSKHNEPLNHFISQTNH